MPLRPPSFNASTSCGRDACKAGNRPERQRGTNAKSSREQENAPIEIEANKIRQFGRKRSDHEIDSPHRENQTEAGAGHSQEQTFDEQMPNDCAAACAQREPNADFTAARRARGPAADWPRWRTQSSGRITRPPSEAELTSWPLCVISSRMVFTRTPRAGVGRRVLSGDPRRNGLRARTRASRARHRFHLGETEQMKLSTSLLLAINPNGIQRSERVGNRQPFGITPTIVARLPFSVTTLPTTPGRSRNVCPIPRIREVPPARRLADLPPVETSGRGPA